MILGIDTSCYTTSIALISETGDLCADKRIMLQVKPGEKGLQQSAAVFQHLQNLPQVLEGLRTEPLHAITVSVKPRPVEGSYLPVFKVGASFGEAAAKLLKIPLITTSHQEGHIRAGLFGGTGAQTTFNAEKPFLAWHLSGGTTELLLVRPLSRELAREFPGYHIEKIGGSSDLQVGQFIDRVGVNLGLKFPAGPALEELALASDTEKMLSISHQGLNLSFSGPAAAAERAVNSGCSGPDLARQVFNCICKGLLQVSLLAIEQYQINSILMAGGVASSRIIRQRFAAEGEKYGVRFEFGFKEFSGDNAVGVALIGYDHLFGGGGKGKDS
jgi:N6-L-threonylcarbamoyladenine synthase